MDFTYFQAKSINYIFLNHNIWQEEKRPEEDTS
jgi:hypothetical protein